MSHVFVFSPRPVFLACAKIMSKKSIAILGSTGSIGVQTLEVVAVHPDLFEVVLLTAYRNADLLVEQAKAFCPSRVVIADATLYERVKAGLAGMDIDIQAGKKALEVAVQADEIELLLTAVVGFSGLKPTISALKSGKHIALANKETLVVAGQLVMELARQQGCHIIPVDSEHSAIFQCLEGEEVPASVEKIYLTASGGPFRGYDLARLKAVTLDQALHHPKWEMGAKITIDSASMMNKGLEVIEACWLFDLPADQIEVLVHPQSIIHSMVMFRDGSFKAQLSQPDMRLPILYALGWPRRIQSHIPKFDPLSEPQLHFEAIDKKVFKNLELAYRALEMGGNAPCILNAANEVSNRLFREKKITFTDISDINERALHEVAYAPDADLDTLLESDKETRLWVQQYASIDQA